MLALLGAERRRQDDARSRTVDAAEARLGPGVVARRDVVADPFGVRREIGVAGQFAPIDELLTGRENLEMRGRL